MKKAILHLDEVSKLILEGKVDEQGLVSHRFKFRQIEDGVAAMLSRKIATMISLHTAALGNRNASSALSDIVW